MDASMSSRDAKPWSYMRTAELRYGNSSRFAMKPARSRHGTGVLPRPSANARAATSDSSSVATVWTSSTSFITVAGLKKWNPMTFEGRFVATAMSMTGSDEVLVASMVSGPRISSSSANTFFFSSRCSGTASKTMSHGARSALLVDDEMRPMISSASACSILPRATARPRLRAILSRPASTASWVISVKMTS
jgi:hypothetical protein